MPEPRRRPAFEDVTETTGIPLTPEGAVMMYSRYHVAAELARGKRVLELGCGAGQGFGLLGSAAGRLVGGDVSRALLRNARTHYDGRVPLVQSSADALPFRSGAFDLIIVFEATYYVADMGAGFRDIVRVLAAGGSVLFVNANPERPDFIKSPYSIHYHTADEFRSALQSLGLSVTVEGAFPVDAKANNGRGIAARRLLSVARRTLEALGLVPKTLRGRARLKRLMYGTLREVPAELPAGFATVAPRVPVEAGPVTRYKVLYVTATKA